MRRPWSAAAAAVMLAAPILFAVAVRPKPEPRPRVVGPAVVTSLTDSGPGSLREALGCGGCNVGFDAGLRGVIPLLSPLEVGSGTVVDGTGADITISGYGLHVTAAAGVTIRGLNFDHVTATSNDDGVQITGSTDVLVEHNTFHDVTDGSTDATAGSTNVTVRWNHYIGTDKTSLLGAGGPNGLPALADMVVDHNWYEHTNARAPMMRQGRFYLYDNLIDGPGTPDGSGYGQRVACGGSAFIVNEAFVGNGGKTRGVTAEYETGCDPTRTPAARIEGAYTVGMDPPASISPELVVWPDTATLAAPDVMDDALVARIRAEAGYTPIPPPDTTTTTTVPPTTTTTVPSTTTTTTVPVGVPTVTVKKAAAGTITVAWTAVTGSTDYRWAVYTCAGALVITNHTAGLTKNVDHLVPGCYDATVTAKVAGVVGPPGRSGQITLT